MRGVSCPRQGPPPRNGVSRLGSIIVGESHRRARYFRALSDADDRVVGHHPTALEDFGYLGLGLPGQLRDLSLTDASLGEQPVDGGDVALGWRPSGGLGGQA
jgi:hypothetical protein